MDSSERLIELAASLGVSCDEALKFSEAITLNFQSLYRMVEATGKSRDEAKRILAVATMMVMEGMLQSLGGR